MSTQVPDWARELTEEVLGTAPVQIGRRYMHPTDGEIEILAGQYWGTHGLSNFWTWRVIATGEKRNGYAGDWPEVTE